MLLRLTVDVGLLKLTLCVVVTMRLVLTAAVIVVVIMVVEIDVVAILMLVLECVIVEMGGVLVITFLLQLEKMTVTGPTNGLGKCSDKATMEMLQTSALRKGIE